MRIPKKNMQKGALYKSLPFKIGLIIILAQAIVLAIIGFIYSQQYGLEIYQQIEDRAMLPAELMSRGLLGIDAMNDRKTMEELLKAKLDKGVVVGLNRIVFSSLDTEDPGRPLVDIADIDSSLFNFLTPKVVITHKKDSLVAVTPVYGSDGRTLRFFIYLQLSTSAAIAKTIQFQFLFILGSLIAIFFTSIIIIASFKYVISRRLDSMLAMVKLVENGELSARDHSSPATDELGLLQDGINTMARQLEKNVTFLEEQVKERTRHLKTAARLVEELNSIHDLNTLLTTTVQQLQQRFSYYQVHIFLLEGENLIHRAGHPHYQLRNETIPLSAEISLIAQAGRTGETVMVDDIRTVHNWLMEPDMPDGLTEIDIPLIHEGKVIGVLDVQRQKAEDLNEGDVNLLRSLAGHLSVALDNVRLFKQLQEQSLKLQQANEQLEERVFQRTNELVSSNLKLQAEIEERQLVENQLRQAQKMEALGRLTGGVAHDFNNILTVILGNCDLLLRLPDDDREHIEHLSHIHSAALQAAALTNQLLAFSRQQVLQPAILNLNEIIQKIKYMLQRLLGEKNTLEINLAADLFLIHVDPSQIEQILMNLIVNASDAMKGGGHLLIQTENLLMSPKTLGRYPQLKPGSYACLKIQDSGSGIAKKDLDQIFDPFFTTKKLGQGTGLGLSTVHGIIKQSNGYITVSSAENQGTIFSIYFPQANVEETALFSPEDQVQRSVKGSETILLVEDEPMVRGIARLVLIDLGYSILEAENAADALKLAAETKKTIALLLTDIRMPGAMNGFDLADTLSTENPQLKILFMSGYIDVDRESREKGNFIQKPFTLEALSYKVREVLDRKYPSENQPGRRKPVK